jgi:5-carboxyvanillate decarboxylase
MMKRIAVEEHYYTKEYEEHLRSILRKNYPVKEVIETEKYLDIEVAWLAENLSAGLPHAEAISKRLLNTAEGRLKEMDESGIDLQVLSLVSPGVQIFDIPTANAMARKMNDDLSKVVQKHPNRFAGFAAIPPQDPAYAADELERAVKKLGLKGALINSHVRGEYLDDQKYWGIFERAEKLGVPIYLHPRSPSPDICAPYAKYPPMATAVWGFGAEVGLHIMRLICSGLFDEFPNLKIILGHLGEALPFLVTRVDHHAIGLLPRKLNHKPSHYITKNIVVTTSGMHFHPALLCTILALGIDNIMFGADYPLEDPRTAVESMDRAPIAEADKEKIYHLNAERLLAL